MASRVDLGTLEPSVERLIASGRYHSKSDALREGVRMVEERGKRQAALDAALVRGLEDVEAGRVKPASEALARAKSD
jgi:antitoxin ParD1/3/4